MILRSFRGPIRSEKIPSKWLLRRLHLQVMPPRLRSVTVSIPRNLITQVIAIVLAISETEQDAVGDASLIGHELTHVVQQLAAPITVDHPQDNFWIKYAADYAANLAAGMSNKQAYQNIPYEREAYAVGRA